MKQYWSRPEDSPGEGMTGKRSSVVGLILSAALLIVLVVAFGHAEARGVDFRLKDLDNRSISFSQLRGEKVTVIDFWATWCKPCGRSIPGLIALNDKYADRGVSFIGINIDSPRNISKVRPYVRSKKIDFPVLLDLNGDVMRRMNVKVVPTLIILDSDDEVVLYHQGYRPGDRKMIEKEIVRLLGEGTDEGGKDGSIIEQD